MASDKHELLKEPLYISWKENIRTKKFHHSTLETYNETPIFIPVDIAEDVFELVEGKLSGSLGPGGTDSESLQGRL